MEIHTVLLCFALIWVYRKFYIMMTSPNGNFHRVTGLLCGELTGEFPTQRPVTRSFVVFYDLHLNQQLNQQWKHRWFETSSRSLWRHCIDSFRYDLFPHILIMVITRLSILCNFDITNSLFSIINKLIIPLHDNMDYSIYFRCTLAAFSGCKRRIINYPSSARPSVRQIFHPFVCPRYNIVDVISLEILHLFTLEHDCSKII